MPRLENDPFLTELTKLTVKCQQQNSGSVQITFKRYAPHAESMARELLAEQSNSKAAKLSKQSANEVHPDDEPALLVHARFHDTKLSTIVLMNQSAKFHRSLSAILTAKLSDTLIDKLTAESKKKIGEGTSAERTKRKRQTETRDSLIAQGTASKGQVKRAKLALEKRAKSLQGSNKQSTETKSQ